MPHRLNITLPDMEINWDITPTSSSSDFDLAGFPLLPQFNLDRTGFSQPLFFLDELSMFYKSYPQVLGDYRSPLIPATAVAPVDFPAPIVNGMPGDLEPIGEDMAVRRTECEAVSPMLKQRSNGKCSRADTVYTTSDSDSSHRASVRSRVLPIKKKASASRQNPYTLPKGEHIDGDKDYHHQAHHNRIEKDYRNRLNKNFTRLLAAVESTASSIGEDDDRQDRSRTLSKGNLLSLASKRLLALEAKNHLLSIEVKRLKQCIYE